MPVRNLARRVESLERNAPRTTETRLSLLMARAGQIAVGTKQTVDAALFVAIERLGTPLSIADVDCMLSFSNDLQP
jgi:hypothetical protein